MHQLIKRTGKIFHLAAFSKRAQPRRGKKESQRDVLISKIIHKIDSPLLFCPTTDVIQILF